MLNIKKIALIGVVGVSPLVLLAAPISIGIKDATGKMFNCVSKGMRIDATGKTVITVESLDCVKENNQELDSDKDGYSDIVEKREGSDPNDPNKTPADFDKDFDPDSTDLDDDNDGYTDIEENKAGTNPKDPNSKPTTPVAAPAPSITPVSLEREKDILDKFNNYYIPYASKAELKPKTLKNGKKVYIVNPGYAATSIPSCVNGKNPQYNCRPTGWTMGIKQNEIYAVRQKTRGKYSSAYTAVRLNGKSGGLTRNANYIFNVSDKPGDMTGTPFKGRCKLYDETSATGSIYFTHPGNPIAKWGFYCEVPVDTVYYLNVELQPRSYEDCNKPENICTGYFSSNALDSPSSFIDKGPVYDRSGGYLY
jgi:hypothetical protein